MTALREQPTAEVTRMPTGRSRITEFVTGIAGLLAVGVGAWMYYAPSDWFLGGLVEGWYFGMFIVAGVLLTIAFGFLARMDYVRDSAWTLGVVVPTVLALAAFGAAIIFALIWIL
ncbi:MAG TPA: hypothetical protein VMP13_04045 [Acidimicrobiia bacterium]|nr:hypothetical protein [Acidimicrobiia bacterium]